MQQIQLETIAHTNAPFADALITDHGKAAEIAAELRSIGATDMALIWDQLAAFLHASENYIFENIPNLAPGSALMTPIVGC